MTVWRQLRAIGPLPATMTILVPALVLYLGDGPDVGFGLSLPLAAISIAAGAALICLGVVLAYRTISLFAGVGEGTLAPWDPTRRLVVVGPYRHVRNPMITGVLSVLLGEGLVLGSAAILICAAVFFVVNAIYMPLVEEPWLARRFGEEYAAYRRNVPRWIPRLRPWDP
jgi:protein-S-isoprenylcysteine O-methyltransferase Ste14